MNDSAACSAKSQDVYEMVRAAIVTRRPIAAVYHQRQRLLCPHRLGRNKHGERRVLCYQYGGESKSGLKTPGSSDNWRCIVLDQLSHVHLLNGPWQSASNHSRPASCIVDTDVDAEDYIGNYDGT